MRTLQDGQVYKLERSWAYRYRTDDGKRPQQGGFRTKGEARAALNEALRRASLGAAHRPDPPTLANLVDEYLGQHAAEEITLVTLRYRLQHAVAAFGATRVDRLTTPEIGAWRKRLPEGSAHYVHRALRQVLRYGVRCKYLDDNPAALAPNPAPKRSEMKIFSWPEVETVALELLQMYRAIPVFAAGTGLRPEEWIGLERRDIDRQTRTVSVQRVFSNARLKEFGKTDRSRRRVPLRKRVIEALDAIAPRLDTPLLFPGPRGGHLDLHNFRERHWKAALRAAGLDYRRPYDLRHTYATFSIAAGVSLFALGRRMGTSLEMIDKTYGHLAPDADEYELALLDAFDDRVSRRDGHVLDTAD
ncbi:MAG: site-specific integrase [Gaiellaceae bacterium]